MAVGGLVIVGLGAFGCGGACAFDHHQKDKCARLSDSLRSWVDAHVPWDVLGVLALLGVVLLALCCLSQRCLELP